MYLVIQPVEYEISDQIYRLDEAMKAGFGWEMGPFELWDVVGFKNGLSQLNRYNLTIPKWIEKISKKKILNFIKLKNSQLFITKIL